MPQPLDIIMVPRRAAKGLSLIAVEQEMSTLVSRALQRRERRKKPGRRKSGGKNTRAGK
jgi:hypothetical protein